MGYSSCPYLAFGEIGIKSIYVSFASQKHNRFKNSWSQGKARPGSRLLFYELWEAALCFDLPQPVFLCLRDPSFHASFLAWLLLAASCLGLSQAGPGPLVWSWPSACGPGPLAQPLVFPDTLGNKEPRHTKSQRTIYTGGIFFFNWYKWLHYKTL